MVDSKVVIILFLSAFLILLPYMRKDHISWTSKDLITKYRTLKCMNTSENLVIDPDQYLYPEVYDDLTALINKEKSLRINIFITYSISKISSLDYFIFELVNGTIDNFEENSLTLFFS